MHNLAGNVSKETGVVGHFKEADKPAVSVLTVHAPGAGFAVKGCIPGGSVFRRNAGGRSIAGSGIQADGIFYGIYIFRGKAGTIVVKRRQQLHLLYRRDLQGGLQPVRGTAGGDVCRYGFVAVSDPVKIVPDDGGNRAAGLSFRNTS